MTIEPKYDRRARVIDLSAYRALRNKQPVEPQQCNLFDYDAAIEADYDPEEAF